MFSLMEKTANFLCGMLLPAVLFVCGILFFIRLGRYVFLPRFFAYGLRSRGSLSSLWLALGGTLGVGNICGVAAAIYIGGAGCVFWIWICAFFSAVTKYAETVLAVKFRESTSSSCTGGAPYYIKNGLRFNGLSRLFCILCIFTAFTMGNITQVKAASEFAEAALGVPTIATALVFSVSVFILAAGKGERISKFTSKTVPFLCVAYSVMCVICIIKFRESIVPVTRQIFRDAFTPRAGMGGAIGVLCSPAVRLGVTRGVMSNEAGCGTAPIAYAADPNALPVRSGLLGICEVLIDTLLLCTLTAYTVLLPSNSLSVNSAQSVINAFSYGLGTAVAPLLCISVFLFALASVSAWAFYATESARFLNAKKFNTVFAFSYALVAFIGCYMKENTVWLLADASVAAMAVLNVISVILLFNHVKKITDDALSEQRYIKMKAFAKRQRSDPD